MKIEKVNENQIRCTLTREDLADRELKISELAYGTEKAKNLFRDMMQQASFECGFEAEDIPLMIEAIPLNSECIVLIITKVEDPEELDTRFSKFAPSVHEEMMAEMEAEDITDEVMNLFQKVQNADSGLASDISRSDKLPSSQSRHPSPAKQPSPVKPEMVSSKIYSFSDLNHVIRLAHVVSGMSIGNNSLYKDPRAMDYRLIINCGKMSAENFNKLCNIFSEYGTCLKSSSGANSYLKEHFEPICLEHALQSLAEI